MRCTLQLPGLVALLMLCLGAPGSAQVSRSDEVVSGVKVGGSRNVRMLGHLPLGAMPAAGDIEVEQEATRPFAYVAHIWENAGFSIINIADPQKPKKIFSWKIENPELHRGLGGSDAAYFKLKGRYYYVQPLQFTRAGPDADLAAVIFDVTGLPDATKVREVGRIRVDASQTTSGFHNVFMYKHSSGRVLLFGASYSGWALVYDMEKFIAGDRDFGLVGRVPAPNASQGYGPYGRSYHDFYIAWDPNTQQDRFYGAGYQGFYAYDVTNLDTPKLLYTIAPAGTYLGHTIQVSPHGKYAFTNTEDNYDEIGRHEPMRIYDLQGIDAKGGANLSRATGHWAADYENELHNIELRWPFAFISAYEDGLQILNVEDPKKPLLYGYYYTCMCAHEAGDGPKKGIAGESTVLNGAWGVDVRNYDGLIVISDMHSGFWTLKWEGFDGWNGADWGVPNISSVQDWDAGPVKRAAT